MDMYAPTPAVSSRPARRARQPALASGRAPARQALARIPLNGFSHALPAPLAASLARRLATASRQQWVQRLWAGDASLWTSHDEGRWLGWLRPGAAPGDLGRLAATCRRLCVAGFTDAVMLGMGGATLGAEALAQTLGVAGGGLRLHILDSTDVAQILALQGRLDLDRTLFVVASKSGNTLESGMLAAYFEQCLARRLGRQEAARRFVAITDPGTPLHARAREAGYAAIFAGDPAVGGRYSVLSPFGLVAAALLGHDPANVLRAAEPMRRACSTHGFGGARNPGLLLGALLGEAALAGYDKVTLLADPGLETLAGWLEQLVAESTGKAGKGLVPVAQEPLAAPGDYGRDRLFVHLSNGPGADAGLAVLARELAAAGHPLLTCQLGTGLSVAQECFRWQIATAVAAAVLGVNPFDQPDVEASKVRTRRLAAAPDADARGGASALLRVDGPLAFHGATSPAASGAALLAALAARRTAGGYVALLAYLPRDAACEQWLAAARDGVRAATGAATLGGFGPRYLHSSGQLHKGGPAGGVFLFVTADAPRTLEAPGHGASFGATQTAQALGDMQELTARGRPCLRVHIRGDLATGLARLDALLRQALGAGAGARCAQRSMPVAISGPGLFTGDMP
ncbi:hypothetical protein [Achromobacter insuavis]|uniref:hypothetical protein n=1 Tax=Achromobacter insuavis TaxID=1287735 RepID=UPI001F1292F6|nr:hypothetical protein [Achromobacter insuavis]